MANSYNLSTGDDDPKREPQAQGSQGEHDNTEHSRRSRRFDDYGRNHGVSGRDYGYDRPYAANDYNTEQDYESLSRANRGSDGETEESPELQSTDDRIRVEIHERLNLYGGVDASTIQIVVDNGEVTLEGMVKSIKQKHMAIAVARNVNGVKDVQNLLRVQE